MSDSHEPSSFIDDQTAVRKPTAANKSGDNDAELLDIGDECQQNLGDLGGAADDGKNKDPLAFIGNSWHWQDMNMTKRHAEERLAFLNEFRKTMPKGKDPHKKTKEYTKRISRVNDRISNFEKAYAEKRVAAKDKRAARIAAARAEDEFISKVCKAELLKSIKEKQKLATKVAMEAVKTFVEKNEKAGSASTDAEQAAVGLEAFQKALQEPLSVRALPVVAEADEVAEEAAATVP